MSDLRAELVRLSESLERLTVLILPVAEPGNPKRLTKDEALACLCCTANAKVALANVAAIFGAMQPPQGSA